MERGLTTKVVDTTVISASLREVRSIDASGMPRRVPWVLTQGEPVLHLLNIMHHVVEGS